MAQVAELSFSALSSAAPTTLKSQENALMPLSSNACRRCRPRPSPTASMALIVAITGLVLSLVGGRLDREACAGRPQHAAQNSGQFLQRVECGARTDLAGGRPARHIGHVAPPHLRRPRDLATLVHVDDNEAVGKGPRRHASIPHATCHSALPQ